MSTGKVIQDKQITLFFLKLIQGAFLHIENLLSSGSLHIAVCLAGKHGSLQTWKERENRSIALIFKLFR